MQYESPIRMHFSDRAFIHHSHAASGGQWSAVSRQQFSLDSPLGGDHRFKNYLTEIQIMISPDKETGYEGEHGKED